MSMTILFRELPPGALFSVQCWALMIEFAALHAMMQAVYARTSMGRRLLRGLFFVVAHVLTQLLFHSQNREGTHLDGLPVLPFVLLLVGMTIALLGMRLRVKHWLHTHISRMSIKEAIDALPTGLCCYDEEGRIHMLNERMAALSLRLFGRYPSDGVALWQELRTRAAGQGTNADYPGEDICVLRLEDGTVWQFRRRAIYAGDRPLTEIAMADITALDQANSELRRRNKRLEAVNARLESYGEEIAELIRGREILNARAAVHDEVGQILLSTRHAVEHPGALDTDAVLGMWERVSTLLLRDVDADEDAESDLFGNLIAVAASIGVRVEIDGALPEAEPAYTLVARGLHACITNVRKHADGDTLRLRVRWADGWTTVTFTNNGRPPEGKVRERGGLGALRQLVEAAGGRMETKNRPKFALILQIPDR